VSRKWDKSTFSS